ncbi:co-chaperone DjlA [Sediminicurvatus halobius]|uniref:Co-chaperone protein DjlA n=1 Tax=Sediminicurvatus halobius TaxID=2182432 RepID=A0A2U2N7K7_9GAMM|nr:co-chaperone DjlA [Spiribacter halobius]PWG64974.1 co-chaperone DjlA [Spiribacter halobius]UEX78167.1 co-chaperone DjlA [Spiribacter halobius]
MKLWIGKLLGAVFGYLAGGLLGGFIGLLVGHWFDRALGGGVLGRARRQVATAVFFRSAFVVMGHVCKADGRVTAAEIGAAERVMAHMDLNARQREQAIEFFRAGRDGEADLDEALRQFRRHCRGHVQLVRMFLEIQIQAALADGDLQDAEHEILRRIATALGLSEADFARLESMLGARAAGGGPGAPAGEAELQRAYQTLGVSEDASDAEVKRAWRKLMSEHHPDKLVSQGLPEEMMRLAKERAQEIQAAYDTIKRARGLR